MTKLNKFLLKLLSGSSDNNIDFNELSNLLLRLNFELRIKGDHHIFYKTNFEEIINIQPIGSKAKAYQVKQIRNIILKYKLGSEDDEQI